MHAGESSTDVQRMDLPTPEQVNQAIAQTRQMFTRMLSVWAGDALQARRCGIDRLCWTGNTEGLRLRRAA